MLGCGGLCWPVAGYLVMLGSPIASNPYAILCFTCLFTFVAAQFALSAFKYAVFLMLITTYSLVLCQYRAPAPPGFHGSVRILYDRLVDVAIGVLVVLALDLILPWSAPFHPACCRAGSACFAVSRELTCV